MSATVAYVVMWAMVAVELVCLAVSPSWYLFAILVVVTVLALVNHHQWRRSRDANRVTPPAPIGAALTRGDGTHVPLELRYVGIKDGLHVWRPTACPPLRPDDRLTVAELPGRTSIEFPRSPTARA